MRTIRFVGDFNLDKESLQIKDNRIYHHAVDVLRLKTGDRFLLANKKSQEADVEIINISDSSIEVNILKKWNSNREPSRSVLLFCSIIKASNFELVVRQATEIGVTEIIPIITERTVKTGLKEDRLEKIIIEATEQSGRTKIPVLHNPMEFSEAISLASEKTDTVVFPHIETDNHIGDIKIEDDKITSLFIGPEGGWTGQEIEIASNLNSSIVTLGSTTLKAETAAITSLYFLIHN